MGHSEYYENRMNARVRLMAIAFNHTSEIVSDDARRPISLVNVHHSGARLRKHGHVAYENLSVGDPVTLNLNLTEDTRSLSGRVVCSSGDDIYVDFGSPLTVGVTDLQNALDN